MAEVFVPSTQGEGQGAAQIFQSNPQFADASGIVRGIERADVKIMAGQAQEYERAREEAKQKRERLNKLYELQTAGNNPLLNKLSTDVIDNFKQSYINGDGDLEDLYGNAIGELRQIKEIDETTKDFSKEIIKDPSKYKTFKDGWVEGSLDFIEAMKTPEYEGTPQEVIQQLQTSIQTFGNNPSNMLFIGGNLEEEYLQGKKVAEQAKVTKQQLEANGDIRTAETITYLNPIERKNALLNNQQLKQSELNNLKLQFGVRTKEDVEEQLGVNFDEHWQNRVNELFRDEAKINVKEELPKRGGGLTFDFNNGVGETELFNLSLTEKEMPAKGSSSYNQKVITMSPKPNKRDVDFTFKLDGKDVSGVPRKIYEEAGNRLVEIEYEKFGTLKTKKVPYEDVSEQLKTRYEITSDFIDSIFSGGESGISWE